jgi:hypothetical protein
VEMQGLFPNWKTAFDAARAELSNEQCILLLTHWGSLWQDDNPIVPYRRAINPVAFTSALPHVFLIEADHETDRLRYRLAGEEINSRYQNGIVGKYLDDITPADALPQVNAYFRTCIERPSLVLLKGILFGERAQPGMGERLLLPLRDNKSNRLGLIGITIQKFSFPDIHTARSQIPRILHIYPLDGSPAEIMEY